MERPWISVNLAISADGKISDVGHRPSGWTSKMDHERLLSLRRNADALMVGRGTLEKDRMSLRMPGHSPAPLRCIVSRNGNLPPDLPVFHSEGGPIHLLVTGDNRATPPPGVTPHHGSLAWFCRKLASEHQVKRLHCEGGGQLIRTLADLDFIDELHLTLAGHTLFGGAAAPTATGIPAEFLTESRSFTLQHFEPNPKGGECFLTYRKSP